MVAADTIMEAERKNRTLLGDDFFYGKQLARYPKRQAVIPKEVIEKQIERQRMETLSQLEYQNLRQKQLDKGELLVPLFVSSKGRQITI